MFDSQLNSKFTRKHFSDVFKDQIKNLKDIEPLLESKK